MQAVARVSQVSATIRDIPRSTAALLLKLSFLPFSILLATPSGSSLPPSFSLSLCSQPFRNLLCPERSKFPRTDHEQYAPDGRNDGFSLISRVLCRVAFIRPERFARLRIIGERNTSWDSSEPNALKRSPNRAPFSRRCVREAGRNGRRERIRGKFSERGARS